MAKLDKIDEPFNTVYKWKDKQNLYLFKMFKKN